MPTQGIAETECTLSLQSQEHVASNIRSYIWNYQSTHLGRPVNDFSLTWFAQALSAFSKEDNTRTQHSRELSDWDDILANKNTL